jgi:glycosyltransferase involved in cell wall biosynthesis
VPKFSIIIPVFNVAEYLPKCIDSILIQSFKDIEIILVNDGSTDNSPKICNDYSNNYSNVNVVHKDNGGASDARNVGINNATGDFILFIDADDYIKKDSLHKINEVLSEQEDIDVMFLEAVKIFPDGKEVPLNDGYIKESIINKEKDDVIKHIGELVKFPASPSTKLIRRSLLIQSKLYFQKGLQFEDIDWSIKLILAAFKFNYCDYPYYCYRQNRPGSETSFFSEKRFCDLLYIIEKWIKLAESNTEVNKYKETVYSLLAYEFVFIILGYSTLNRKKKNKYKNTVKNNSWILDHRNDKNTKIVKLVYKILGINCTGLLLNIYSKYR